MFQSSISCGTSLLMIKMAVSSVVILMVLFTSVLQVDGSYFPQFYRLQKALESALITEETLYTMRQAFFPVERTNAQETQQVCIRICVEITVDRDLNSTINNSCIARESRLINMDVITTCNNKSVPSLCWRFLWTDSALLSLITIDQMIAFDIFANAIYNTAIGMPTYINACLQLMCPVMPNVSDIKTSLMFLLSRSKSYARHYGVPPQWEETDKGYIQEYYGSHYLAESVYNKNDVHLLRLGMIISFTLLNIFVLIGVLSYGKQYYIKIHQITSGSTRLTAVTWAFMTMAVFINSIYLFATFYGYFSPRTQQTRPKIWICLRSEANWCISLESTGLYSDVVASLLMKLTVVPFTIVVELIIAVRLTSHTLLRFPHTIATTSQCCSFRNGKRIVQTILIWNVMALIQITFGVIILPVGILMVVAPVSTISWISTVFIGTSMFIGITAYFILRWCNPISLRQCCSIYLFAHLFTTVVILSLSAVALALYYYLIQLGVEPWSVKGSILSFLPSFLVTPLLWFAKRYFFKKDRATEEVEQYGISMTVHDPSTAHSENIEEEEEEEEEDWRM